MEPEQNSDDAAEEASLLDRVGAGDREAFRQLYARYSTPLHSLALRMVGDRTAAEELLQDAFVRIWRHASAYDSRKSRPFTWAVTIVRRTCIDHLRKHRRIPPPEIPIDVVNAATDPADSPRRAVVAQDDADHVRQALAALPDPQRRALELALFSSLTHGEIAAQLGHPLGTVKSWIRRGLLDLRTTLSVSTP